MADVEAVPAERKSRKSVAFADGAVMVDNNGEVTMHNGGGEGDSADSHSKPTNGTDDAQVDEATSAFDDLALKKKKKSKKPKEEPAADADETAVAEEEFDPAALKKKKKKKAPKADDFDAKLAEAEAEAGGKPDDDAAAADDTTEHADAPDRDAGDMDEGTGVWAHDSTAPINYDMLLGRFFKLLNAHNPDLMSSGAKSYKIPPPQCLREGNKKTIFANLPDICRRMKRSDEHVTQFLFAELGTHGSTDGSRRLVIKGKFLGKQIENVLRRYIMEYVTCKTCKSPDTELVRGENRLYFVNCNSCGSRRSVTAIKAGFSAQVGKRKRQQG